MEQYIDKNALVAEIKWLDALYHTSKDLSGDLFIQGLFCFLDTFEMKELDLEEEIERVRKTHFINDDFEKATLEGRQITNIAKHFFKLGLKVAQKGEKI